MSNEEESLEDMKARARRERMELFFNYYEGLTIEARGPYDYCESFTIEELYQAFKERMLMEMDK